MKKMKAKALVFIDDYSPLFITIQQVFGTKGRHIHQMMQYSFSKSSKHL